MNQGSGLRITGIPLFYVLSIHFYSDVGSHRDFVAIFRAFDGVGLHNVNCTGI